MAAHDKNWAKAYVSDPLTALEPSDETGPGTHFGSTFAPSNSKPLNSDLPTPPHSGTPVSIGSNNPFRRSSLDVPEKGASARVRASSDTSNRFTPPNSPRNGRHSGQYRRDVFRSHEEQRRRSGDNGHRRMASNASNTSNRSRGDSLGERPLEFAKYEEKLAHRSPHLRKKHLPGTDTIDRLDVGPAGRYHHEGPYDAALLARNTSWESSPVAATMGVNSETLRATPLENIRDAIEGHRPLDGVAAIAPGSEDRFGRRYNYKDENLMITEGNYKRWPGVEYHPDDLKGKGEPSYSIEKALKEHKLLDDEDRADRVARGQASGIELQDQSPYDARDPVTIAGGQQRYAELEHRSAGRRSGEHKRQSGSFEGLKKRIGSLGKRKD
ncbi:hypothetical protein BLS_003388 [Venturia inaequalis]|uniref:Pal1 cell morphology protein n=1 Tax=Venturia inaequalis TaxID=5025 RepID=A0A8H3YVW5_VENIN|nr:hypothetical protein BLS_003388 [Venturia inaequalis]